MIYVITHVLIDMNGWELEQHTDIIFKTEPCQQPLLIFGHCVESCCCNNTILEITILWDRALWTEQQVLQHGKGSNFFNGESRFYWKHSEAIIYGTVRGRYLSPLALIRMFPSLEINLMFWIEEQHSLSPTSFTASLFFLPLLRLHRYTFETPFVTNGKQK